MAINLKNVMRQMHDFGIGQSLLRDVGLDYRQSSFTRFIGTIGIFSAGMLVGAAFGMLFAPMRGDELRIKARDNIDAWRDRVASRGVEMASHVSETVSSESTIPVAP